jgi:hypothetical protein
MGGVVKVKSSCCKSGPRCKRCPVVFKKLERAGHAEKVGKRRYVVPGPLPKSLVKAARARA